LQAERRSLIGSTQGFVSVRTRQKDLETEDEEIARVRFSVFHVSGPTASNAETPGRFQEINFHADTFIAGHRAAA